MPQGDCNVLFYNIQFECKFRIVYGVRIISTVHRTPNPWGHKAVIRHISKTQLRLECIWVKQVWLSQEESINRTQRQLAYGEIRLFGLLTRIWEQTSFFIYPCKHPCTGGEKGKISIPGVGTNKNPGNNCSRCIVGNFHARAFFDWGDRIG